MCVKSVYVAVHLQVRKFPEVLCAISHSSLKLSQRENVFYCGRSLVSVLALAASPVVCRATQEVYPCVA